MLIFQKDPAEFERACPQAQGGDFYSKQKKIKNSHRNRQYWSYLLSKCLRNFCLRFVEIQKCQFILLIPTLIEVALETFSRLIFLISFVLKFLTKLWAHFKNSKHSIVSNFYFKYSCCIYYFYDLQYNFFNSFKGTSVEENHV